MKQLQNGIYTFNTGERKWGEEVNQNFEALDNLISGVVGNNDRIELLSEKIQTNTDNFEQTKDDLIDNINNTKNGLQDQIDILNNNILTLRYRVDNMDISVDSVKHAEEADVAKKLKKSLTIGNMSFNGEANTVVTIDSTPTQNSTNLINSNAVYDALELKQDKATTLNGYNITDAYTKSEIDTKLNTKANDSDVVHKSGNETINGTKTFTSEIVNTSVYAFRHIYGNYGTFWRQDGSDLYLMLTNSGDQYGGWNNFRPLTVNLANGLCDISGTATKAIQDSDGNQINTTYSKNGHTHGDYWSKSATGNQYSYSTFSYLSTIDKATTNTSWSIYRPFRIVDKDNSMELGCVEYGYKSDLAYTRLTTRHSNGGWLDFTIHSNGASYFDNCNELWLVNRNLNSYNTPPSKEVDTQIWFMDKNSNKYATLQTDYYADGVRQFALTHKSLRTNNWVGLNIRTTPTDDVIVCQPRFQAKDSLIVQNDTDPTNMYTHILNGWVEMSDPNYCYIDFKHAGNQDYLGRIGLNSNNILHLDTINGAPIMANGKNIVRSVNGVNADSNGNVNIQNSSLPIGSYIQFAGSQAPSGFLVCNGGAISRTTYANLFAVIGTTYGSGDGSTTFNLPNLTDRFLQGSTIIGTVKYAGLPNIMGTINIGTVDNAPESYSNGALSMVSVGDQGYQRAGGVRTLRYISFNASNYNQAYGNSSTIQPPALTCLICIKY